MTDFSTTASWAALERKDLTGFLALNGYQMFVSSSLPPTDRPSGKRAAAPEEVGDRTSPLNSHLLRLLTSTEKGRQKARSTRTTLALGERLARHIEVQPDGCWLWIGRLTDAGYGQITHQGVTLRAHRVVYEVLVGAIPDGHVIDHHCRVPACVNPAHLEAMTQRENVLRSVARVGTRNAAKTHCPKGHPYDEVNTYRDRRGDRACRECQRARTRLQDQKRRAARLSLRVSHPDARAVASGSGATEVEDRAPAIAPPSVAPAFCLWCRRPLRWRGFCNADHELAYQEWLDA